MTTYPPNTVGWLKYAHSKNWFAVEVLTRFGNTSYEVRRSRTTFAVGPRDVLIVVGA